MIVLWQRALCEKLGWPALAFISFNGITALVAKSLVSRRTKETRKYLCFKEHGVQVVAGWRGTSPPVVKARDEIVAFGAPDELQVDENGVVGGGVHLKLKSQQTSKSAATKGSSSTAVTRSKSASSRTLSFPTCAPPSARSSPANYDHVGTSRSSPTAPAVFACGSLHSRRTAASRRSLPDRRRHRALRREVRR